MVMEENDEGGHQKAVVTAVAPPQPTVRRVPPAALPPSWLYTRTIGPLLVNHRHRLRPIVRLQEQLLNQLQLCISRESSMKQYCLLGSSIILDQQQELGSHKRSSSVVAKLMGLEALSDSEQIDMNQTQLSGVSASPSNSYSEPELRIPDLIKNPSFRLNRLLGDERMEAKVLGNQFYLYCRNDLKVPYSPFMGTYAQGENQGPSPMLQECFHSVLSQLFQYRIIRCGGAVEDDMANIIVSQLLYLDVVDPNKDIVMYVNSPGGSVTAGMAVFDTIRHIRPDVSTVCVGLDARYGEIEKRLADLEFKKSGKDLRALKQILAAMQKTKELLETRKEEQVLNISLIQSSKAAYLQSVSSVSQTTKATGLKSPIVIIKSAKHLEKVNVAIKPSMRRLRSGSEADNIKKKFNQQRTRDLSPRTNHRTSQTIPPPSVKVNSGRASGTLSPRLQQHRKLEFENEKRSQPPTPLSESSRMRKPPNSRQPISSGSPRSSPRPKSQTLQDELQHGNKEQSPEARFINEKLVAGPARGVVEQPSPISVLDAPFDGDESPSPVKKISNAFKGKPI